MNFLYYFCKEPFHPTAHILARKQVSVQTETSAPRRVLIGDDDLSIREFLSDLLSEHGFVLCTAEDGYAALPCIDQFKPDLVLTDIVMPNLDGLELISCLRKRTHDTARIIAFSGSKEAPTYLDAARALGADAVIQKPFSPEQIVRVINSVLALELNQSPGIEK